MAEEVLGAQMVNKLRVRNVADGTAGEIACSGLFAYIGLEPTCDFAAPEIARDSSGFLITDASLQTAMPGVYAAGAVRSGYGGTLSHAVTEAHTAAASASAALGRK